MMFPNRATIYLKQCLKARRDRGHLLEELSIKMNLKEPDDALRFDEFEGLVGRIGFDRLPLWPHSRMPVDFALHSRFTWKWEED